jgi:hypothetical protein
VTLADQPRAPHTVGDAAPPPSLISARQLVKTFSDGPSSCITTSAPCGNVTASPAEAMIHDDQMAWTSLLAGPDPGTSLLPGLFHLSTLSEQNKAYELFCGSGTSSTPLLTAPDGSCCAITATADVALFITLVKVPGCHLLEIDKWAHQLHLIQSLARNGNFKHLTTFTQASTYLLRPGHTL